MVFYDQAGNAHWLQRQCGSGGTFVSPGQDMAFAPAEGAGETMTVTTLDKYFLRDICSVCRDRAGSQGAISDICGPATWTHVTPEVATGTPNGAPTTAPTTPAPSATTPAAPTILSQTHIVVFSVTGTGEPSIQYGNGATTNDPSDGAGPLSDGNYLPWNALRTYSPAVEYYAVAAQLEREAAVSALARFSPVECTYKQHR